MPGQEAEEYEELSAIIERINRDLAPTTKAHTLSIEQLNEDLQDAEMIQKAKANTMEDFRYVFVSPSWTKWLKRIDNERFFARILDDEEMRNALMEYMLPQTYRRLRSLGEHRGSMFSIFS